MNAAAPARIRFLPRLHSARELAEAIEDGSRHGFATLRTEHLAHLEQRDEVFA